MPDVYQKALANMKLAKTIAADGRVDHTRAVHGLAESDLRNLPLTHGGHIMAGRPAGVPELFNAFCARFNHRETTRWKWSFAVSYLDTRSAELLDDARTEGECKIIAGALQMLVNFPPPLGLGLTAAVLRTHEPTNGFYSFHPTTGVFGLPPDVIHPHGDVKLKTHMQPLCFWTNHKVMEYGGRFYDPSYGNTYAAIDDMEAFRGTGVKKAGANAVLRRNTASPLALDWWREGLTMYMIEVATPHFAGYRGPYRDVA